jgi:hypothetical protein
MITDEVAKNHDETMLELLGFKVSKRSIPRASVQSPKAMMPVKFNSEHKPKLAPNRFSSKA